MIVIVGAGLAGLSTAYHLDGVPYRVFEREPEVGGLCRSYRKDGFTFDYTGHLLHFRQAKIKALIETLLAGRLAKHSRRSYIYSHRTYTEYPFQVNTFGLPPEVVRECLLGFIATLTRAASTESRPPDERSFKAWILENLGEGMARHFMVPFNEKLWQVPLDELTSDWVSWLVPKPELKDVVNGALGIKDKAFGYNPSFLYPAQGGIEALPRSFLPGVREVACRSTLIEVDTERRQAVFSRALPGGGQETWVEDYETLVSTIPLPELVRRCTVLPDAVREAAEGLRCVSVYNANLGVAR
jgi:protoporphyrinogen oxidase